VAERVLSNCARLGLPVRAWFNALDVAHHALLAWANGSVAAEGGQSALAVETSDL